MENFIYAPSMALLNRLSGIDDWFKGIGRNIYYTSLMAGIVGGLISGPVFGLVLMISFLSYRLPGWYDLLDVGTDMGGTTRELILMAARQTYVFPVFAYLSILHMSIWPMVFLFGFAVLASASYGFGFIYRRVHKLNPGLVAEGLTGMFLGLAIALSQLSVS